MGTGKLEMCVSLSHSHSLVYQETDENGKILRVLYLIRPLVTLVTSRQEPSMEVA